MERIVIDRVYLPDCTIGVVTHNGFRCFSLEPPMLDNLVDESCIYPGLYECEQYFSSKYKVTCFHVLNVIGRTGISGHYGNFTRDTKGCILVGETIADINNDFCPDVTNSKRTLAKLMDRLPAKFQLLIQ